jgi:hypothetical protein
MTNDKVEIKLLEDIPTIQLIHLAVFISVTSQAARIHTIRFCRQRMTAPSGRIVRSLVMRKIKFQRSTSFHCGTVFCRVLPRPRI